MKKRMDEYILNRLPNFWVRQSMGFKLLAAFTAISLFGVFLFAVAALSLVGWRYRLYLNGNSADFQPIVEQVEAAYALYGWELMEKESNIDFTHSLELSEIFILDLNNHPRMPTQGDLSSYRFPENLWQDRVELQSDGQTFGYMLTKPISSEFRYYFSIVILASSIGAMLLSAVLTWAVSYVLVKPIVALTEAASKIADGEVATPLPVRTGDELGDLSRAFNRMNREVNQSREMRKQLTADIAHDIRSPLGLIVGHAEGLRDGVFPDDLEAYDLIHEEAMRISRLVEDLSTLSRAEAGVLSLSCENTSPNVLLDRVVTAHSALAQTRAIKLEMLVDGELPQINVDRDRMAQVLDNLVTNAFRYTPDHGWIRVSAVPDQSSNTVHIKVQDSGTGIPAKDLPHIFQRFYRGDKSRNTDLGGSGLGLAIAKWIVQAHDGSISAESPPGQGATFHIYLPLLT